MNKASFYNKDIYSETKENELKKLIENFPYFQLAYIKLLKNLYQNESIYFENHLRKSSVIVPSRKALYQFLQTINKVEEKQIPIFKITDIQDSKQVDFDFEKEMLSWAMAGSYKLEERESTETLKSTETIQPGKEIELENETENQDKSLPLPAHEKKLSKVEPKEISIDESAIEKKPQIELKQEKKKNFKSWLSVVLPAENLKIKEDLSSKEVENKETELTQEPVKKDTEKQISIIDQFIGNENKISKKQPFFDPARMAKKSVEENDEIISETLAKIYHSQGNKTKSIEIYQKLILKFPTKKDYFADLILKIKKEEL